MLLMTPVEALIIAFLAGISLALFVRPKRNDVNVVVLAKYEGDIGELLATVEAAQIEMQIRRRTAKVVKGREVSAP
jgi:hypothetical protein